MEATIYEPIIMLMPFSWNVIRIRKLFVCLNAGCFYLFGKLIVLWISRFLLKQSSMSLYSCDPYCVLTSSEEGYVSLFNCWLILFVSKLFLTWNSKFFWKQTNIILQWDWCLLCDSGIKLVKFVFVSKLSLSLYLNCCWPGLQSFCGRNHLWAHNHVEPSMSPLLRTGVTEIGKFQFAWGLFLLLTWKTAADTNFQGFRVKNYLWTYNHVDACCLMTSSEEKYFFLS